MFNFEWVQFLDLSQNFECDAKSLEMETRESNLIEHFDLLLNIIFDFFGNLQGNRPWRSNQKLTSP